MRPPPPHEEPLERAIRQARVLDIDPMEIFFKLAQSKLKEIMSGHIARRRERRGEMGLRGPHARVVESIRDFVVFM